MLIIVISLNNILKILSLIHNQGIRLAMGAFRTSLTTSIMCNAGEHLFEIRRIKETLKFATKSPDDIIQVPIRRLQNMHNSPNTPCTINGIYKTLSEITKFNKIIFQLSPSWNIKLNIQLLGLNNFFPE